MNRLHRLGRVGDHDEAVSGGGHDLFPRMCGAPSFYQPTVGRDLVGAVDGHVEMIDVGKRFHVEAKFSGRCIGTRGSGDAANFEFTGGQRGEKKGHRRPGAEPDRHAAFYQFGRRLGSQPFFVVGAHVQMAPRSVVP